MAASEVLELINEGCSPRNAFEYVQNAPIEDRYVKRLAAMPPTPTEMAEHFSPSRPLKMASPIYPAAMKLTKTDGEVVIEFIVDTTGRVREPRVVSSTHQSFTDHALAAVKAWRYTPAYKDGRAVNIRIRAPINFKMRGVGGLDVEKVKAKAEEP